VGRLGLPVVVGGAAIHLQVFLQEPLRCSQTDPWPLAAHTFEHCTLATFGGHMLSVVVTGLPVLGELVVVVLGLWVIVAL